jgi:hypothetical protein
MCLWLWHRIRSRFFCPLTRLCTCMIKPVALPTLLRSPLSVSLVSLSISVFTSLYVCVCVCTSACWSVGKAKQAAAALRLGLECQLTVSWLTLKPEPERGCGLLPSSLSSPVGSATDGRTRRGGGTYVMSCDVCLAAALTVPAHLHRVSRGTEAGAHLQGAHLQARGALRQDQAWRPAFGLPAWP